MNPYTLKTIKSWKKMPHEHVKVNEFRLRSEAILRADKEIKLPAWDTPGVHPRDNQAFVRAIFWHTVVNFAFTLFGVRGKNGELLKFTVESCCSKDWRRKTIFRGSMAMGACFYRAFGEKIILARDILPHAENLNATKWFFGGTNSIPMVEERWELLLEACEVVERDFAGDPWNIWEEGRFRAYGSKSQPGIVEILKTRFPKTFGQDMVKYGDSVFYFDKRAHLAVLEYHDRAEYFPKELPLIEDIYELGPVPDYELPRSYFADGLFEYSPGFEAMISCGRLVEPRGQIEMEIRGATCFAQTLELECANTERAKLGLPLWHIGHVDFYRWSRGKALAGKYNHHLCRTTAY